jgi:hypothetical protein
MLATKGRAGGAAARAALLRPSDESPTETAGPAATAVPTATPKAGPTPPAPPVRPTPPAEQPESADTVARLREAKQRARDRENRDHG